MVDRKVILSLLPPYKDESELLVEDQEVGDIIDRIIWAHKKYAADYDRISYLFWQGDPVSTAENIFNFEIDNIGYCIEPREDQSVKSPTRIIVDGSDDNEMSDCKHYALFAAGILDSLKREDYPINWCYRFANYDVFGVMPQHVFIVLKYNGKEYWIDPVVGEFDYKKKYVNCIDKTVPMLYSLSGIGNASYNSVDIPMNASRGAYLVMLTRNLLQVSSVLDKLMTANKWQVRDFWNKIGGNYSDLEKIVPKTKGLSSNYTNNDLKIIAVASPILTQIFELAGNNIDAITAAQDGVQALANYHSSGTIGDALTDVATVANFVPGVGSDISAGLNALNSLFGGGSSTPVNWVTTGNASLQQQYAAGLNNFYQEFCGKTFRIGNDYSTIFVATGAVDSTGAPIYANSGLTVQGNFPNADVYDLFNFVLTNWPKGIGGASLSDYSASWNQPYLQFMKNFVSGQSSIPSTTSAATVTTSTPITSPATSASSSNVVPGGNAAPIPSTSTNVSSSSNNNLWLWGAAGVGLYLVTRKK